MADVPVRPAVGHGLPVGDAQRAAYASERVCIDQARTTSPAKEDSQTKRRYRAGSDERQAPQERRVSSASRRT